LSKHSTTRNRSASSENAPWNIRGPALTAGIARQLFRLGWPLIITQCVGVFMQVTDALFVAELGDTALAAISPAYLMTLLPVSFGIGLVTTVSSFVSQSLGSGRLRDCQRWAVAGVWISALLGVFSMLLIPTAPYAFGVFGHSLGVFELEVDYFSISLGSIGFQMAAMALGGYFIGIHRPKIAMAGTVIATLSNVVFDYGFIFGKFGFPALGFDGAAWGTVAAAVTQFLFMAVVMYLDMAKVGKADFGILRFSSRKVLQLLRVGTPYGLQSCLEVLATGIVLIWLIGLFGEAHLAAATIVIRCAMISHIPPEGIASGLTAMVGKSIGEQRYFLATFQVRVAYRLVATYISIVALGFILFRSGLAGLFSSNSEVIRIGGISLAIVAVFQILDTMSIVYGSALRAAGDTFWPMMANGILCAVVFIGGGLLIVNFAPQLGSIGVWVVDGLFVVCQGLAFRHRWRSGAWRNIALLETEKDTPPPERLEPLSDRTV
jgi:MATE family multidrug resistance protein